MTWYTLEYSQKYKPNITYTYKYIETQNTRHVPYILTYYGRVQEQQQAHVHVKTVYKILLIESESSNINE